MTTIATINGMAVAEATIMPTTAGLTNPSTTTARGTAITAATARVGAVPWWFIAMSTTS
jgi:hypothetical protein